MQKSTFSAAALAGLLLLLLSGLMAVRWIWPFQDLAVPLPGAANAAGVGLASPVLFFAAALCALSAGRSGDSGAARWLRRIGALAIVLLITWPVAQLIETFADASFGLDVPSPGVVATPLRPFPGRMSPNAAAAFMLTGLAFALLPGSPFARLSGSAGASEPGRRGARGARAACIAATVGITVIGLAGLAGHLLGLEALYRLADFNRLLPWTAFGFIVVAGALWALLEQGRAFDLRDAGERIQRRSLVVVALLALTAGVIGFGTMRDTFEDSVAKNLLLAAGTTSTALAHSIDVGLWYPKTLAARPDVLAGLQRLDRAPQDEAALRSLQTLADSVAKADLSAAAFYRADGRRVAGAGKPVREQAAQVHVLRDSGLDAVLAWHDGHVLAVEIPVVLDGRTIGRLKTEQPLRLFDRLLAEVRGVDGGTDAAVCSRSVALPGCAGEGIAKALAGERGLSFARDTLGQQVVTAYVPIRDHGLALGVRTDLDTLYAPLRSRLALLFVAMLGIVALAIYALRSQVQPVVRRLVESERRMKRILEDQTELVSVATREGVLTYVNPSYARHFGLRPDQLVGDNLYNHVDPADVETVRAKIEAVMASGQPATSENRMRDPHGPSRWISWTNSVQLGDEREPMLHSVGRDVTERRLAESEQQRQAATMRSIAESIPATVAVVGRDRRYRFVNSAFERWSGLPRGSVVGRSVDEVLGPDECARREAWMQRVLAGETVSFELEYSERIVARHLVISYVPLRLEDGAVDGFVGVAQDITRHRQEEVRLLQLAQRDALTGLLNRSGFARLLDAQAPSVTQGIALLYVDLDLFKPVNDRHGHPVGDQLLRQFAQRLAATVRPTDIVARLGGDEFAVALIGVKDVANAHMVAEKVVAAAREPFMVGQHVLHIGASVGVAFGADARGDWQDLLERADSLLYRAKAEGRSRAAI